MKTQNELGLFQRNFRIYAPEASSKGLIFDLTLSVYTPSRNISGYGILHQNEDVDRIETRLTGHYQKECIVSNNRLECTIYVSATGTIPFGGKYPPGMGPGPFDPQNVKLTMYLNDEWEAGTASYAYMDGSGSWHHIDNQQVISLPVNTSVPTEQELVDV